jgi:hypothetical protein
MDAAAMNKQMIQFQRAMLNTSFETAKMLQNQTESIVTFWQKQMGMPEMNQKFMEQWTGVMNKGLDQSKQMMDEAFDKMEAFMGNTP